MSGNHFPACSHIFQNFADPLLTCWEISSICQRCNLTPVSNFSKAALISLFWAPKGLDKLLEMCFPFSSNWLANWQFSKKWQKLKDCLAWFSDIQGCSQSLCFPWQAFCMAESKPTTSTAILIWLYEWEITFHTFHASQNTLHSLWLVKIDNGSDFMNTTSHRVYQTGEGGKWRDRERPRTFENQAKDCFALQI